MIEMSGYRIARPADRGIGLGKDDRIFRNSACARRGVEPAGVEFLCVLVIVLADTKDVPSRRRDGGDNLGPL